MELVATQRGELFGHDEVVHRRHSLLGCFACVVCARPRRGAPNEACVVGISACAPERVARLAARQLLGPDDVWVTRIQRQRLC
jgi:hypothetical protein